MLSGKDLKNLKRQLKLYSFDSYQDFLDSDLWKEFRKVVKKKTVQTCNSCFKGAGENLHHRSYKRLLDPNLVIWLCNDCHKKIHKKELESIDKATQMFVKKKRVESLRILDNGLPEVLHQSLHASGIISKIKGGENPSFCINRYYERKVLKNDKVMVKLLEDNYSKVMEYCGTFTTN